MAKRRHRREEAEETTVLGGAALAFPEEAAAVRALRPAGQRLRSSEPAIFPLRAPRPPRLRRPRLKYARGRSEGSKGSRSPAAAAAGPQRPVEKDYKFMPNDGPQRSPFMENPLVDDGL